MAKYLKHWRTALVSAIRWNCQLSARTKIALAQEELNKKRKYLCIHFGVYGEIVSVYELSISPFTSITSILTRHPIESNNNNGHSWNVFHEVRRLYQCVFFYIIFDILLNLAYSKKYP